LQFRRTVAHACRAAIIRAMQGIGKCGISAPQNLKNLLKFHSYLFDNLLTLRHIRLGVVTGQALSGASDREAFVVQQTADLANDQHVLPLIVATIATPFDWLELREFLLPVPEHVRLDRTEITHLTDREVSLSRNGR